MGTQAAEPTSAGTVTVRYWAGAKAAAGVDHDVLEVAGPVSLTEVVRRVRALHDDDRFSRVVQTCSALVGDRPASGDDPDEVVVEPGSTVELLPPFAGG